MRPKVFICYRRDDDPSSASRLRIGLAEKLGKRRVFMDVANLVAGQRFESQLYKELGKCNVLIAVIGPRWLDLLNKREPTSDYVCKEISAALARSIPVLPVRVGHSGDMQPLPQAHELPDSIKGLVAHHMHDVRYGHFDTDIAELANAIQSVSQSKQIASGQRGIWMAAIVVIVIVIGVVAARYAGVL